MREQAQRVFQLISSVAFLTTCGIALRLYHYLRDPAMWHDEAALVINALDKSFLELLGPLQFQEAAPPLFLWAERAMALVLGDSTFALRLIPLFASCGGLILMAWVASTVLSPASARWAVLLFEFSDRLLWHACEAKPYATDILAALSAMAVFLSTRSWPLPWRLTLFIALTPLLILASYPGCFVLGGVLLSLLPATWQSRRALAWTGYFTLASVAAVCFALLLIGPIHAQRGADMDSCWVSYFPDWSRAWTVPYWMAKSSIGVVDYCCRPLGGVLTPLVVLGSFCLWRRGERVLLTLIIVPCLLALFSSLAGRYPFGGARILVYSAPAVVLCIGEAIPIVLAAARSWNRAAAIACGLLIALPPASLALYRTWIPWDRADTSGAATYVLNELEPVDIISANHWEYLYYFRSLGSRYVPLDRLPNDCVGRLWLVVSAGTEEERVAIVRGFAADGWTALTQRDFSRTTVLLMSRLASEE
jgi:hypothetical protein